MQQWNAKKAHLMVARDECFPKPSMGFYVSICQWAKDSFFVGNK